MSKQRICAFALCYLTAVVCVSALGLDLPLVRADQGAGSATLQQGATIGSSVLLAPADQVVAFIGRERFGPLGQWTLLLLNALLWGWACEYFYSAARERFSLHRHD